MRTLENVFAPKWSQWGEGSISETQGPIHILCKPSEARDMTVTAGATAGDKACHLRNVGCANLFESYIARTLCIYSLQSRKKKQGQFDFIVIVIPVSQVQGNMVFSHV